jgi:hypothetical protein
MSSAKLAAFARYPQDVQYSIVIDRLSAIYLPLLAAAELLLLLSYSNPDAASIPRRPATFA